MLFSQSQQTFGHSFRKVQKSLCVQQFGSKIRPNKMLDLIWLQTVCKSYQALIILGDFHGIALFCNAIIPMYWCFKDA